MAVLSIKTFERPGGFLVRAQRPEPPEPVVGRGLLMQRHTDAADQAPRISPPATLGLKMRPAATALIT
jgi:hypothetical protein